MKKYPQYLWRSDPLTVIGMVFKSLSMILFSLLLLGGIGFISIFKPPLEEVPESLNKVWNFPDLKVPFSQPAEAKKESDLVEIGLIVSSKINFSQVFDNFNSGTSQSLGSLLSKQVEVNLSPGQFNWPVQGRLTQGFANYHKAIDIAQRFGTEIRPIEAGVVEKTARHHGALGNVVVINHGGGFKSLYAHLDKINVSEGGRLDKGSVLGTIGLTGRTTGPHVHLEVYQNGVAIDPRKVLP
jgi:murein DD-endopeptidase MepM/ murein hydrolase activator NlpD